MVYGFAKQSGGHVKIYSEIGHGTTVKLFLPRSADEAARPTAPAGAGAPRGGESILLVEDNADLREAAKLVLEDLGYRVTEVANAAEALAWLDRGEPVELLFSDVVMDGEMGGERLAGEAVKRRPALKVLLTTGYAPAAMADKDLPEGTKLLGKPYRRSDLARTLRTLLDEKGNPS
jgi:DNA-binding NtrC family response regulator